MIMSGIHVYNITKEEYNGSNVFYCGRGSVLGNPYTHLKDKPTKAVYVVKDRDTAIEMYGNYFDVMYGSNKKFTDVVDEIYGKYKNGEDVYLGCYCKKYLSQEQHKHSDEVSCHCDIIVEKLRKRLIKEKIASRLLSKKNKQE